VAVAVLMMDVAMTVVMTVAMIAELKAVILVKES
jgi:hypothetical protein